MIAPIATKLFTALSFSTLTLCLCRGFLLIHEIYLDTWKIVESIRIKNTLPDVWFRLGASFRTFIRARSHSQNFLDEELDLAKESLT